ncbi:hypothetical protein PHYBLDRAFT_152400 [Phycomyces blakesleeanus NRRL 1555(-)]|uniref:Secreted protein n=1 Tax=Phycomyces blakesleeanus (strain ATCC 8743b / DSM 1359 / FGSC 10004 / NBRC 33097 / NRRL 1555) TaxID=763407 RepID=A0A167JS61_PHYB8|nr:hypothetical protein PHYBLDRAFT_152400 [Phycomyces blakesleeanus NRRL 1555(-)]OAD66597.1 hypothetical protein PHYBLDRAFT_152400 [Phycomyces blakesleeanus NRRL 1555(-)]|eukprot:XP_018284637.1 hypothetical protein PHYBLDRAFT_152400 [Phycomyces blakesleeanus NRRL 1555(-)]
MKKIMLVIVFTTLRVEASNVDLSEWLRSVTRNHMGSARVGSNPAVDEAFEILTFLHFVVFHARILVSQSG